MRRLREALVDARVRQVLHIVGAALRAERLAVRPAEISHKLAAVLGIGEVHNGLLECLRKALCAAHRDNIGPESLSVKYIYALNRRTGEAAASRPHAPRPSGFSRGSQPNLRESGL